MTEVSLVRCHGLLRLGAWHGDLELLSPLFAQFD